MKEHELDERSFTLTFVKQLLSRQILVTVQPAFWTKQPSTIKQIHSVKFFLKELYEAEIISTCDDDEEVDITNEKQFNTWVDTYLDRYIAHVQYLPNDEEDEKDSNRMQKYIVTTTYGAYINRKKQNCTWRNSYFADTKQGRQVSLEPFSRSIDLRNCIASPKFSDMLVI